MKKEVLYSEETQWAKSERNIIAHQNAGLSAARERAKKPVMQFVLEEANSGRVWTFVETHKFGHSENAFTIDYEIAAIEVPTSPLQKE